MADPNTQDPNASASGITKEQLHQQVEKARVEEREKLRSQIDKDRETMDRLRTENDTLRSEVTALKADLTNATTELTSIKASLKPDGGVDITKVIEQSVEAAKAALTAQHGAEIADLRARLQQESTARTQLTLEQTKAKLIEEAGGRKALIPEVVRGTTEEELRQSIEESKALLKRTLEASQPTPQSQNVTNGNQGAGGASPVHTPIPGAGGDGSPSGAASTPQNVRGLSPAEYAKRREELKKSVSGRYAKSLLTQ